MSTQIKSGRGIVVRPGVHLDARDPEPGEVDRLVDEAVARFERFTDRDAEFERRFGRWRRPEHLPRYPIERWANRLLRWSEHDPGIVEAAAFVRSFPDRADRTLVAEIARFCAEAIEGKFATDKTLNLFRLDLLRRLDAVGF